MSRQTVPVLVRAWRTVSILDMPALVVGALAAIAGHRWGAYVLVANIAVQIGLHLLVGGWAYRDVMSRPWPEVAPIEADAWDD